MRFCLYCRKPKPRSGFTEVYHDQSATYRGQCADCQGVRRKSRDELERLAKQKKERK